MERGTNGRFVLTTRNDVPKALYELYAARGEAENRIKDFKPDQGLQGAREGRPPQLPQVRRQPVQAFVARMRYWLMDVLRRKPVARGTRRIHLDTLRLGLIKIGGRVREVMTKVRLHLASRHPGRSLWHALSDAFGVVHEWFGFGVSVNRKRDVATVFTDGTGLGAKVRVLAPGVTPQNPLPVADT